MTVCVSLVGIYLLLCGTNGLSLFSNTLEVIEDEGESVVVQLVKEAGRDVGHNHLKESLTFEVTDSHSRVTLHLRHNNNINVSRPVYILRNGKVVPQFVPSLKHVEYYQDIERNAAVGIVCELSKHGAKHYELEGVLNKGNGSFVISPNMSFAESGEVTGAVYNHILRKLKLSLGYTGDYVRAVNVTIPPPSGQRRRKRQGVTTYNVEMLMLVDYAVYQYWYNRTSAASPTARDGLTKDAIRQYYAFILNGMDLRYESISESDLAFGVLYSGLFIADSGSASPWTEDIKTLNGTDRPLVDSDQSLTDLRTWILAQASLPGFDHAMGFTAYDLSSPAAGSSNTGLAYVGAICSNHAVSISENFFNFQGLIVAAHELGHNLGAGHDGVGNACDSADQYIMGSRAGGATGPTALNPWHFSACSVDAFRTTMASLYVYMDTGGGSNCLLSERAAYDPSALDPYLGVLPGQAYDADTQCSYSLGETTAVCRQAYSGSDYRAICAGMFCYQPGSLVSCMRIYPGRGTSCGDKMWCLNGQCVDDPTAPAVPDSCPVGDRPGPVYGSLTCAEMVDQQPAQCYAYNRQCCSACLALRTNYTDCEYGDKDSTCSTMFRGECYTRSASCCGTCPSLYNANFPGCEYGDSWTDCDPAQCQSYTGEFLSYCCETCCAGCLPFTTAATTAPPVVSTPSNGSAGSTGPSGEGTTQTTGGDGVSSGPRRSVPAGIVWMWTYILLMLAGLSGI